jgi:hypothetical protein
MQVSGKVLSISDDSEDPNFHAEPAPEPEVSDREWAKFVRAIRRARTVAEKQLLAFDWAHERITA